MKKIISLFVAIIMVMGLAQVPVYGAEYPDRVTAMDRVEWTLDEEGVLTIQSEITSMPSFASSWNYYGPWYGNKAIKKIILPDTIEHIGSLMFGYCTSLTEVVLPKNLKELEDDVFAGCTSLEKITISEENAYFKTVEDVLFDKAGQVLLMYPTAKKNIEYTIPEGVTSIKTKAFMGCEAIEKVNLPSTLGVINKYAFANCIRLDNVAIPQSVTYMGSGAFEGCVNLKSININGTVYMQANPFENTAFYNNEDNWEGDGLYADKHLLDVSKTVSEYTIKPDTVSVAGGVFALNKSIKKLTLPGSVKCVGDCAFANNSLEEMVIEEGLETIGNYAFYFSEIESITLPESLKIIGGQAFLYSHLRKVVIPDNVIDIGEYAFSQCSLLESITFGKGLGNICDGAFEWCDKLTEVTIPDNVLTMGYSVFGDCNSLTDVYIGSGLAQLDGSTIGTGDKIQNVHISENNPYIKSIDGVAFDKAGEKLICYPSGRKNDTYTVPDGVKVIGEGAFKARSLKTINLPESVRRIENSAFSSCSALTNVYYGGTREEFEKIEVGDNNSYFGRAITEFATGDRKNIYQNLRLEEKEDKVYVISLVDTTAVTVEIPGEINGKSVEIQSNAFTRTNLQKVVLDERIKNIPYGAFSNCTALEEINLENVETIGGCAFAGCKSLKEVNLTSIKSWSGIKESEINESGTVIYFPFNEYLYRYEQFSIITVFYNAEIDTLRIKWPEVNFDEGANTFPALFVNSKINKVIFENFTISPSMAEFKTTGAISTTKPRWQSSVDLKLTNNSSMIIYGSDEQTRLYAEKIGAKYEHISEYK